MIFVCNTGPLIALAKLASLALLQDLGGERIFIPPRVQYLRQNRSTCKGFCRFIELLSATTTTPNPQEALDGHLSMFAMPATHRPKDHVTPMPPHCYGDGGHTGACDDVGPIPVGWPRRQFSDSTTLFRNSDTVGHAVLGVLSAPYL